MWHVGFIQKNVSVCIFHQLSSKAGILLLLNTISRRCEGHPSPATSTGLVDSILLPMPSCPFQLAPQHLTPPPIAITHVCSSPTAMATAETSGERAVGVYI
jgi:hypothetical protein